MPIDEAQILAFVKENPTHASRRDIARALKLRGKDRRILSNILTKLEADGAITKTGRGGVAIEGQLPPTGLVIFNNIDNHGDLWGRAAGKGNTPFGPPVRFAGYSTKARGKPPGKGDRAIARFRQEKSGQWTARLIRLIGTTPSTQSFIATFNVTKMRGLLTPVQKKNKHRYFVSEGERGSAEDGDLVRATPLVDKRTTRTPIARIDEVLGRADDPSHFSHISAIEHEIPQEFPKKVTDYLTHLKPSDSPVEDLRDIPLITIDPVDARDHDDAVFAEATPDGGWRVIVAIADVAAYVTPGSPIDREAHLRGNSTYFPDRVIPMLPFTLSAGACSLKQDEDRRVLGVEMFFNASGQKDKHRFFRAVMRSAASLSYQDAQAAIDAAPNASARASQLLESVLKPLWGAYHALAEARTHRAPLDLDITERVIKLDETGRVHSILPKTRLDAHRLIEEMMIAANVAAAETLELHKIPFLYRIHERPSDETLAFFSGFLKSLKIDWSNKDTPSPAQFNNLLKDTRNGDLEEAVSESVLRCQTKAIYAPQNIGHFGLALRRYAHFTSPIRRYADVIVHRALIRALNLGQDGLSDKEITNLEEIARHISQTERRSMAAERDAVDRYTAHYLAQNIGKTRFFGIITGVTKSGLFVRLEETGADGFIPISSLSPRTYFLFDDIARALIAEKTMHGYQIGHRIEVTLKEVVPVQGGIILSMQSAPRQINHTQNSSRARPLKRRASPERPSNKSRKPSSRR